MNRKLKTALKRRASEEGFAIPVALGIGLIAILVGITMVLRSQNDQVTASAQKATNRGLSAAEIGITRYQSLINSNRAIAVYNRTDPSGGPSWENASTIPGISNTCTGNVNGATAVSNNSTRDWKDIDSSDSSKGQYRLWNYIYSPDKSTLTVDGRVNQAGSGNTASNEIGTATTRLQVQFLVDKQSSSGIIPALWMQNIPQSMGSNKVNGNILVPGCTLPSGVSQNNVTTGNTVTANPNAIIPDTPPLPTSSLNTIAPAAMDTRIWGQTLPKVGDVAQSGTVLKAGDVAQSDDPYHYLIQGDLAKNGGANIALSDSAKVVFYVQGNINLGGGPNINVSGNASNMQIYGNSFLRNPNGTIQVDAAGRPLAKYGCTSPLPVIGPGLKDPPSNYRGACPTTSVAVNGNASVHALIHAPDAVGAVSGGGGDCNSATNTGFIGAVWIKQWNAASGTSNALVCVEGNYGSFLATLTSRPPSIPAITAWQRQEVQP